MGNNRSETWITVGADLGVRPMQRRPLKPVGAGLVPARPSAKDGKAKPDETDPDAPPPVDENLWAILYGCP